MARSPNSRPGDLNEERMPTRPTDDIVAGATPADGTPDDAINAYRPSSPPETLRRF